MWNGDVEMLQIFIITGPCGVGKSTVSKELTRLIPKSTLIHGDDFLHIYNEATSPPWEEMLAIMWKNILSITQNLLQHQFHVIIDTVVEDELEWFCRHFSHMNVQFRYVVLRADASELKERILKRGDVEITERSLFLLEKLENETAFNKPYLYDTMDKAVEEIAKDIIQFPPLKIK